MIPNFPETRGGALCLCLGRLLQHLASRALNARPPCPLPTSVSPSRSYAATGLSLQLRCRRPADGEDSVVSGVVVVHQLCRPRGLRASQLRCDYPCGMTLCAHAGESFSIPSAGRLFYASCPPFLCAPAPPLPPWDPEQAPPPPPAAAAPALPADDELGAGAAAMLEEDDAPVS